MYIPDPDFYPSPFPDLTTATKEEGEKICCPIFFEATNFTILKICLFFLNRYRKKIEPSYKELLKYFLHKKLPLNSQKNRGLGSGIRDRDPVFPDPEVKRYRIRNTG
jgi:hypothetical protein